MGAIGWLIRAGTAMQPSGNDKGHFSAHSNPWQIRRPPEHEEGDNKQEADDNQESEGHTDQLRRIIPQGSNLEIQPALPQPQTTEAFSKSSLSSSHSPPIKVHVGRPSRSRSRSQRDNPDSETQLAFPRPQATEAFSKATSHSPSASSSHSPSIPVRVRRVSRSRSRVQKGSSDSPTRSSSNSVHEGRVERSPKRRSRRKRTPTLHVCSVCDKTFWKESNLRTHVRVHTGETPYECRYEGCSKRFKWKSSLTSHHTSHRRSRAVRSAEVISGESPDPDPRSTEGGLEVPLNPRIALVNPTRTRHIASSEQPDSRMRVARTAMSIPPIGTLFDRLRQSVPSTVPARSSPSSPPIPSGAVDPKLQIQLHAETLDRTVALPPPPPSGVRPRTRLPSIQELDRSIAGPVPPANEVYERMQRAYAYIQPPLPIRSEIRQQPPERRGLEHMPSPSLLGMAITATTNSVRVPIQARDHYPYLHTPSQLPSQVPSDSFYQHTPAHFPSSNGLEPQHSSFHLQRESLTRYSHDREGRYFYRTEDDELQQAPPPPQPPPQPQPPRSEGQR